jgi:hypothetical protein
MADPCRFLRRRTIGRSECTQFRAAKPTIDLNGKASTATMKQISATNAPIEPIPSSDKSG